MKRHPDSWPLVRLLGSGGLLLLAVISGAQGQVYEKIYSFTDANAATTAANIGKSPRSPLVRDLDGNFYGTTYNGGANGYGTVFKMTSAGVLTTMVEFTNNGASNSGSYPGGGLVQGNDGNFYGTTGNGGATFYGTVFKMTPAGVLTTLVGFTDNGASNKGSNPGAALTQGTDGNFYGTTTYGGTSGIGTVFKVTPAGVLTTLVNFTGTTGSLGSYPFGALLQGTDGNFYGTTWHGGASDLGTVFRMTPAGVLTTLVEFTGTGAGKKGSYPFSTLLQATDGNFYGTTSQGGATDQGTVFRMTPAGTLTTLVEFTGNGASNKGYYPQAGLVQGSDGNFYGTTYYGGAIDRGTLFKMTPAGVLTTLVEFTVNGASNKGSYPYATLTQGSDGNFYGSTIAGGAFGYGTEFKVTPSGGLTTLVEFTDNGGPKNMGRHPYAGLVQGGDGSLYGTTREGGATNIGTAFKVTAGGVLTKLVDFDGGGASSNWSYPEATLELGSDGNFYGTTTYGGTSNNGTVFKMTPGGGLTTLANFTDNGASNKGRLPGAGLVRGSDGNFYGTTNAGATTGLGSIYKMTPAGALTTLVEFTGNLGNGRGPFPGLVQGTDGNFYGASTRGGTNSYGTFFKMTPAGVLTTLLEFTGTAGAYKGQNPNGPFIQSTDGNFYGTTYQGGASNFGTVFKVSPGGVFTTLVEFTGNGASNKGSYPRAALVRGSDGNFYGTTTAGGATDDGTVFKVTPLGVLTTLFDFSNDSIDSGPRGELVFGSDGNLYGTASGQTSSSGSVFRLVYPGVPDVFLLGSAGADVQSTAAVISVKVNARGSATTSNIEYGTDGVNFPNSLPLSPAPLTGYHTTLVGTTLNGLTKGSTYYYRIRATSSAGTTLSAVASFSTLAEPVVTVGAASSIAPASAQFNGTVNARNYDATVVFQYGTDGNTFPNQVAAVPGTVTGSTNVAVNAAVAGLTKGTTYYYRISAANAGGTIVSGASSFTTLTDPVATIGPASYVTSNSAILNGFVNAKGATTAVTFEYGTDGVNFPNSVGATPASVTGNTATAVSATVGGLAQGTTYYYRVKGTSAGGLGVSSAATFAVDILSGFTRVLPAAAPPAQGYVFVSLLPGNIASGWRFVGEQLWRPSGLPVGGLATGDRQIEYRPVPGYIQPLRETVSVISGGAASVVTAEYYPTPGGASGGMTVVLKPDALPGAQWRLLGENDTQWRNSGVTVNGLIPGVYLVECKPVAGRTTPPAISVPVSAGQTKVATATYLLADAGAGTPPTVLPFETVNSNPALPYAFVGQLRNDVGVATGFVVKARVVATAAHVVFDDGSLSYVTGLQWLFQRDSGTYEPKPQIPRGFYVFNGYAAQRTADATPGQSTPASQNLDAAALYFLEDAGRGGFGGYLGSDTVNNEFLLSSKLKMLVGYPVDGIAVANQGRMHATPAGNATFTLAYLHTFATADIRSSGGNSGGPLCVQFDDGKYYPAAIYLGGTAQTVVRAIDSGVIDLFNRAEVSGNGGANNVSGGISQVDTPFSGTTFFAAALKVDILPAAAVSGGATWKLSPTGTAWPAGQQLNTLAPGDYTLQFTPVAGFLTPVPGPITLTAGNLSSVTATYNGIITQPADLTVVASASATFTVGVSGTPTSYQWRRNGLDIAGANAASYTRTNVTIADTGNYSVVVTWGAQGSLTSANATLNVSASIPTGDFNADGKADILWQNTTTGERYVWFMSGTTYTGGTSLGTIPPVWSLAGNADFNADGKTDLVWQNTTTGERYIWLMNGTTFSSSVFLGVVPTAWQIAGTGDFNGDGKPDLLWQNTATGERYLWLMNGTTHTGDVSLGVVPLAWSIVAVADFNGDGKPDLLWQNTTTGERYLWLMNGVVHASDVSLGVVPLAWSIVAAADYNGDGKPDILWQNTATGERYVWFMNGTVHTADVSLGIVDLNWQLVK